MSYPRKKDLEIQLSKLRGFNNPKAWLEQYSTDPILASYLVNSAFLRGDIRDKNVLDAGAGTGVLSYSALYYGCKSVTSVEIDEEQRQVLMENLKTFKNWEIVIKNAQDLEGHWDTVMCNTPFGSQMKDLDIPILTKVFESGDVVYLIHNWKAKDFVIDFAKKYSSQVEFERKNLIIPRLYKHHTREYLKIDVILLVCAV